MQGPGSRKKIVAGFVTVAGVIAILAFDAARQGQQTEALARQYAGEQWDVARACLLGTPIGRGQDEEAIRALLDRQLVLAMAAATREADRSALWPARCVPLLRGLHVDASILRSDPGDALATLEVLAPRVLEGEPLVTRQARARAHELAGAVAALDAAMPSGAEYDPREHEPEAGAIPPAAVLGSLECAPPRPWRRPVFDARSGGDALYDELSLGPRAVRVTGGAEGGFARTVASPEGTRSQPIAREGALHPLAWDEDAILWVMPDAVAIEEAGAEVARAPLGASVERAALCRTALGAHLLVRDGRRLAWVRWPAPSEAPEAPVAFEATPSDGAFLACGEAAMILAWPEDAGWRGVLCEGRRCEPLPPLPAGGDLQIAIADRPLAVARGLRSDLSVARALVREDGALAWSDPVPVVRGALGAVGGGFRLEACNAPAFVSEDGRRWRGE